MGVESRPSKLSERLEELRAEYRTGTVMLRELDERAQDTREQLLRIAGAIRVLEELLEEADPGGDPDDAVD